MTDNKESYLLQYSECGDYEQIEEKYDNLEEAEKEYNRISKLPNHWVYLLEIKKMKVCS